MHDTESTVTSRFVRVILAMSTVSNCLYFRILLLRRLRLPIQFAARTCRCRRTLDLLGDHRAACAQSGVLRSRGGVGTGSRQGMPGSGGQGHHPHIAL